jgi:hypothetical protein
MSSRAMQVAGKKENDMQRIFASILAVGVLVVFSGVTFADGSGMCSYGSHTGQASADKTDTAKSVATKPTDKINTDKLVLVQTQKSNQPASEPKK